MIQIYANYFWLWGMEISDPNAQYSSDADTSCPIGIWGAPSMYRGCHIINNYIHDVSSDFVFRNGMCSYGDLQTTIYGNIVFGEGHNIYVQNDYEAGGYKYVVNNMFMDVRGGSDYVETPSGDSVKFFNVHAYVESATHGMGKLSGMYFENNIIKDGRFLVGSDYEPDHHHVVNRNYFSNARCQVGYSVPAQAIVSNNKLVWSPLQLEHTWGTGETQYASWQTEQTAITGNMVICPENTTDLDYAQHIRFGTDAFTGSGIQQSTSIRPDDDVDENMYSSEFSMYFSVEGDTANGGETEWKDLSESHGNGFDTNGIFTYEVAAITANVIPNDYDSSMFYIAIFRLSFSTPLVHLDLCTYMSEEPWQSYVVSHYRDLYGEETSGSTGDCSEVEINMGTSKFEAYVLKLNESSYIPHGSSSPQPSAAHPLSIPSLFLALTCYLLFLLCL
ncbi:LVIVD repeat protein [Pelomyxa schiedti]|nr:LVIVD repeat protein [Pelomyxa schiedti]